MQMIIEKAPLTTNHEFIKLKELLKHQSKIHSCLISESVRIKKLNYAGHLLKIIKVKENKNLM